MKKAFILKCKTGDKFFIINYSKHSLAINYGITQAIGKYKLYNYGSEKECIKNAKLIIEKVIKKGYKEYKKFNFQNHIYLDDVKVGAHHQTTHPNFLKYFKDDFYFDKNNDWSPFLSSEGKPVLEKITKYIKRKKIINYYKLPKILIRKFDITYIPLKPMKKKEIENIANEDESYILENDKITYSTTFAQIKITGMVDKRLKLKAIMAIKRCKIVMCIDKSIILDAMINSLKNFTIYS